MKVGMAKRAIAFPKGFFPTEGFSTQVDELHTRALLLEDGRQYMLISVEMTSLPPEEIAELSDAARRASGADECFVCVTHTFSAPHLLPDHLLVDAAARRNKETLKRLLRTAVTEAAGGAAAGLTEARLFLGVAQCGVNKARDIETPDGWWVDACGGGPVDHRLTALRIDDAGGKTLGLLLHYPVQSSVLDGSQLREGGKAVSGDLAGVLCAKLEERFPNATAMFLIGAAGDQAPVDKAVRRTVGGDGRIRVTDKQNGGVALCRELGGQMANAAAEAITGARPMRSDTVGVRRAAVSVPAKKIERDLNKLHPTRIPPYEADGQSTQVVELLTIGDLMLVGVKPELCCLTALTICEGYPTARVTTLFNGGAKYMADAASYDRITYEAMNSPFGRGAAEKLAAAARGLLNGNQPQI